VRRHKVGRRGPAAPRKAGRHETASTWPSTLADTDAEGVAYHEAAHAVYSVALGLPLDVVVVGSAAAGALVAGYTKHEPVDLAEQTAEASAAIAVAGMAGVWAERYRRGERYPGEPDYRRERWEANMRRAVWHRDGEDIAGAEQACGRAVLAVHGPDADRQRDWPDRTAAMWRSIADMTEALFGPLWPAIGDVAVGLLERGTLTGADVATALTDVNGAGWVGGVRVTMTDDGARVTMPEAAGSPGAPAEA
jgi:hypothetical protein